MKNWNITARGKTQAECLEDLSTLLPEVDEALADKILVAASTMLNPLPDDHPKGYWINTNGLLLDDGTGSAAVMAGTTT